MCFPVNNCCLCISLEAGTKIISVLSLICSTATVMVYTGAAMSLPAAAQTKQCFYMLVAVYSLCNMVVCSLLIYGAFRKKPRYLWPWLVTSWISCIILVLLSLLGVVLLTIQYYKDLETINNINTMSTFYFLYTAVVYYCVTVVQSRRMQMIRAEETSSNMLMPPQDVGKTLLV